MLHVQSEARLAPEHRIYVNRNLRMANVRAVGFDLDHTLAHYRGAAVEELAYRLARQHLVKHFGYPSSLLEKPYDRSFVIRGLVIDKRRGNILKMDYHNYVSRGCHGFRMLEPNERNATYRSGRVRMASGAYVSVDTLFHLPEVYLYQVLVDLAAGGAKRKSRSFARIFENVRASVDAVHADGSLKREILSNPDKYIRRDPRLVPTLNELSRAGKKLFLLTNSEYYYTHALLEFLLRNGNWHELFDLIVVDAGKPGFFATQNQRVRSRKKTVFSCPVYHGGNASFLEKKIGFRGDQVLYFGDHTYGDILRSKKSSGWRTAMVVEELREEIEVTRKVQPQMDELNHWKALRGVMESDLSALEVEHRRLKRRIQSRNGRGTSLAELRHRLASVDHELARQVAELANIRRMTGDLGDTINESYNSHWGPIFREGSETSRFGHQVKDFACIYMTRVSNLLNYDMNHYYRSAAELMPHELI
jgi:HAD superfamily 5'-nucleotidase-like hydrolase